MRDILPKTPPPAPPRKSKNGKRAKISWVAVLFLVILAVVLIILGERLMADLNGWLNPAYGQYGSSVVHYPVYHSKTAIWPGSYDQSDYGMYKLLIHTAFVIPLLLAGFLLYFWMYYKKPHSPHKIISWPYFIFAVVMTLHIVVESFYFIIKQYEKLGIYLVLVVLIILLTWLAVFMQKKRNQSHLVSK